MALYEREIDHEDIERVKQSLLRLRPGLSWREVACLRILAEKPVWEVPFKNPHVGIWELEQLDRRGWVQAQEMRWERASEKGGGVLCIPEGPWFGPLNQLMTSGRPDWQSIVGAYREGRIDQVYWWERLVARIRLTDRGYRAFEFLRGMSSFELDLLDEVAYALQRAGALWRERDEVVDRMLASGFSTAQGGFEKIVRDELMVGVRSEWASLQESLIPRLAKRLDPGLRDEIRAVVRGLNPDSLALNPDEGRTTQRWRLYWRQLELQEQVDEVTALLFAMSEESTGLVPSTPSATAINVLADKLCGAGKSVERENGLWTVKLLAEHLGVSETTISNWRNAAEPKVPPRKAKGSTFDFDEIRHLADGATKLGHTKHASKLRAIADGRIVAKARMATRKPT